MCMSRRNHLKSVLLHSSIHPPYPSSTATQLHKLDWPYKTNQLFISSYFQSSSSWISPLNIGYFHKYFSPIYRKYALSKSNKPSTAIWPKNASLTEIQLMRLQYHCRSSGSSVDDRSFTTCNISGDYGKCPVQSSRQTSGQTLSCLNVQ